MQTTDPPLLEIEPEREQRLAIGPIEVDGCARETLIEGILNKALHGSFTHQVATVNAQFYVLAESDFAFQECLKRAEFVCADGVSIGFAAHLLAGKRVERLAGVDLVEEICRRGAGMGLRVYLLGGRDGSAALLAEMLNKKYPGIKIAGVASPPLAFEKSAALLDSVLEPIRQSKPHVVFVALGAPKQELFIDQYLRNLRVPVAIGVGGSFEIITGFTRRAPEFVQRSGMEWLFRLLQEPRRLWRRYILGNPQFLWIMGVYWFQGLKKSPSIVGPLPAEGAEALSHAR